MINITSYEKRIKQLNDWESNSTNPMLKQRYESLLGLTNFSANLYLQLCNAATSEHIKYINSINNPPSKTNERIENIIKDSDKILLVEKNDAVKRLHISFLQFEQTILEIKKARLQMENTLHKDKLDSIVKLQYILFDDIYKPSAKDFSKDLILESIGATLGFVPVWGNIIDILTRIVNISEYQIRKGVAADNHLNYLYDYEVSISRWIVSANSLLKALS